MLQRPFLNYLLSLYPPRLMGMLLYVQIIFLSVNFNLYDSREPLIVLCWVPILLCPYYIFQKKFIYVIVLTLFFIDGLLNLGHILILRGPISASSLFILSNTNAAEASEFMELKAGWSLIFLIPYVLLYIYALKMPLNHPLSKKGRIVLVVLILASVIFVFENAIHNRLLRKGIPQSSRAIIFFASEMKSFENLKKRKARQIDAKRVSPSARSQIFVLIIGESCNRKHMSLYDYPRCTNPRLEKRKDLIVFKNAVSPYSNTLSSLLSSLTESNLENHKNFDESMSLVDIFHSLGFKTYWVSNQSPIGVWDNAIYNLAQTCDRTVFVNTNGNTSFESTYLPSYDENVLTPFSGILENEDRNKLIVVHLMGSHAAYKKRYPERFSLFKEAETEKSELISQYDNSVLYTDFVVDSLLNTLDWYCSKNPDCISSCIYFSDHGENVYDEGDQVGHDYAGTLPGANVEIPFFLWLSPAYCTTFEEKKQIICSNTGLPYVNDDLFHCVLDLNHMECGAFEKRRSVFCEDFEAGRKRILEDNKNYDEKR